MYKDYQNQYFKENNVSDEIINKNTIEGTSLYALIETQLKIPLHDGGNGGNESYKYILPINETDRIKAKNNKRERARQKVMRRLKREKRL